MKNIPESAFNILKILERSPNTISGEIISNELGVTRSAVLKSIKELRLLGYDIESSKKDGYRLVQSSSKLLPYEVQKSLRTTIIGKQMRHFENTQSTNNVGKQICTEEDPAKVHGTVIIAEKQTGGVGRLGRAWISPTGGIWITIILKPKVPIDRIFMITMAGAVAVARAIRKEFDIGALIKWPNDIFVGKKKIGGLLLEISADEDVVHYGLVGIGINVNNPVKDFAADLQRDITSISTEVGADVDRAPFLAQILREFETRFNLVESGEYDVITQEWKSLSATLETRVQIRTPKNSFEGEAIDIDEFGALIVKRDNGKLERVIAGDCTHQ